MSSQATSRIDVVVVSYNSRKRLRRCVESLAGAPGIRVIVVDNASQDGSLDTLGGLEVTTVPTGRNGGFAFGCNVGWRAGDAPSVLFLNPDATMTAEAVCRLADRMAAEGGLGALGARIVHPDGSLDFSLRRFPRTSSAFAQALFAHRLFPAASWSDELVRDRARYGRAGDVDWVSGACLMVRRSLLERLGGFDEGFFMYSEDTDLCRRVWDAGLRVGYEPAAVCVHEGGASAPRASLFAVHVASRLRYAHKHRGVLGAAIERLGLGLWAVTHLIVASGGLEARSGYLAALGRILSPRPRMTP